MIFLCLKGVGGEGKRWEAGRRIERRGSNEMEDRRKRKRGKRRKLKNEAKRKKGEGR